MATRRYKISVGESQEDVVSEAGAATNSDTVELTIDLATTQVGEGATTRTIKQAEVITAVEKILNFIQSQNTWPPA